MSKYGAFSGPNAGRYGPEKTLYLDTFHAVHYFIFVYFRKVVIPLFDRNKSVFEIMLRDMDMISLNCQLKLMALVMVYVEIVARGNVPLFTIY